MLFKKMLRTIWRYKAQFISMVIMIAIGVGIFLGFNMEWVSLDIDTTSFLKQTNFADYRIVSEDGFTSEDAKLVKEIDGIDLVSRYISFDCDVDDSESMLAVTVTENFDVSSFYLMEGKAYDESSEDGIWLFDMFAKANNLGLGDELKLSYENIEITGKIEGLIESGEHMISVRDEQIMPDFEKYGYAYISPVMLKNAIYDATRNEIEDKKDDIINEYIEKMISEASAVSGAPIPAEFIEVDDDTTDDLIGEMIDEAFDETYKSIYPQINVITDLDKETFTKKTEDVLKKTLLILSKDETVSYSESQGEVNEGKTMGSVLPVLFLLIAVLTMVTTMHRLAANEKTQIGTLKALGFKNRRILWHYTTFALAIGIVGSVIGIVIGYLVAHIILNPDGMMGTYIVMPDWSLHLPWWCWLVIILIIAFLTLIGYLSTRKMLEGNAADTLRPYTPKNTRRLAIEKMKIMSRLKFGTKWNLRDILRHKARSLMTLFGIIGCTLLIVAALGASDTMSSFIKLYYDDISDYSSRVYIASDASNDDAKKLADKLDGDWSASISVQKDDSPISMDIFNIENDTLMFLNEENEKVALPDDGALVCLRIKEKFDLEIGDEITVSPYGTNDEYKIKVGGFNRSLTENISMTVDYAKTLESDDVALTDSDVFKINSVYTRTEKEDIGDPDISSIQTKQDMLGSMDSFMEIMYTMIIVLVVAAVVLGIIVLYNLGIMSFTERYREMATLKVVGFKDKQIGKLLISQNMWLSILGIILGIPAGYGILVLLMDMLASEYEMQSLIYPQSILISVIITLAVSLVVGLIIAKKNRKIEMVAALKTGE